METIPVVDLRAQYFTIKDEIDSSIAEVIANSSFIGGQYLESFEESFAKYQNTKWCVGVSSGTSALFLSLKALGIKPDDEVITTPLTFMATVEAIEMTGAKTLFVDIDPVSYTIDPEKIEAAITPKTKAIIPVHLYGQMANMKKICEIAQDYGLLVIEDAAQAHGAKHKDRRAGEWGQVACFSFFPSKNLGAYGDGGAVCTNDAKIAGAVSILRDHGRESKYVHRILGYGERLDGIQAAILKTKLRHLDSWNDKRREKAFYYNQHLDDVQNLIIPHENDCSYHVFHIYCVRVLADRESLITSLYSKGINTGIHYPIPLHLQPSMKDYGYKQGDYPIAEKYCSEVLSLPIYPEITFRQMDYIIEILHNDLD